MPRCAHYMCDFLRACGRCTTCRPLVELAFPVRLMCAGGSNGQPHEPSPAANLQQGRAVLLYPNRKKWTLPWYSMAYVDAHLIENADRNRQKVGSVIGEAKRPSAGGKLDLSPQPLKKGCSHPRTWRAEHWMRQHAFYCRDGPR